MIVRHYEVSSREISAPIRIALVTDLHSCYYGPKQHKLISAIDGQVPDLILLGGDIFDNRLGNTNTELFLAGIAGRYPCYFVTGNHEYYGKPGDFPVIMSILGKYGVIVLSNRFETVCVNGATVRLCGVDDPHAYMLRFDKEKDPQGYQTARREKMRVFHRHLAQLSDRTQGAYSILLSHRPELLDTYASYGFDLVLCGHAHGGQWRIPGLLNGLYAPHQGLFPPYAGGMYHKDKTTMIVSRGLARETVIVPRIFNPPELVVITLK